MRLILCVYDGGLLRNEAYVVCIMQIVKRRLMLYVYDTDCQGMRLG